MVVWRSVHKLYTQSKLVLFLSAIKEKKIPKPEPTLSDYM